jgi:caspase domain-containing protein
MTDVATPAGTPAESCALLVGVSAYEDPEFPPIRAARNSLNAMRSLLSDPALCAWPPEKITVIANPLSAADLATSIADLAAGTTGVLLLYYVGHGLLSARGELCLTVTSTRPDRPKISGLPWDTVADVLRSCPAHTRLAILDCCFAGQAIEALTGDGNAALADIAHVEGVYTLTATTRNRPAHVPSPARQDTACTSFTAELEDLVRSGLPGKPPRLTLSDIYPVLGQRLRAKGLPAPGQHGADAAQQFPFTANAAVLSAPEAEHIPPAPAVASTPPAGDPQPPPVDQSRYADIVADALRATHSIADESVQAPALAAVAEALAAVDPDRAGRLAADAERVAESVPDAKGKAPVLAAVAHALVSIDTDRAERVARSITDTTLTVTVLAALARAVTAADPDRAGRLVADAERIAQSISGTSFRAPALAAVAGALAALDQGRARRLIGDAEHIAQSIPDANRKASALAAVAEGMAAIDPEHAERIAQSITSASSRAVALAAVAKALGTTGPGGAAPAVSN